MLTNLILATRRFRPRPLQGGEVDEAGSREPGADLSPLKGMPLDYLQIPDTQVSDLSPLEGMPLKVLNITGTKVTELSPLKDLPLERIVLDFQLERDTELLRSIKTLKWINNKPVAEFWKELEEKPAASTTSATDVSPDRRVAEWVIARGGQVIVNGREGRIDEVAKLPAGELQVTLVKFFQPLSGSDADLVPLRELQHLEFLGFDGVNVSMAGLAGLDRLPKLERISRGTNALQDEDVVALARLKNLRSLFIASVKMTPAQCMTLARTMPQLTSLNLIGNGSLDDAALAPLGEMRDLTKLQLQGTKVTAAGVAALQKALPNCLIEWDDPPKPR